MMARRLLALLVQVTATLLILPGAMAQDGRSIEISGYQVMVEGDIEPFRLDVAVDSTSAGLAELVVRLSADNPATPPSFGVSWSMPSVNIAGHWTTRAYFNKTISPDWYPSRVESQLARDSPVISLFGSDDANRLTFAVSDALNPVTLTTAIREEDGRIYNSVRFFEQRQSARTDYEVRIRFDTRERRYDAALADVAEWWSQMEEYEPSPVPTVALQPMYSTWYSYHQSVDYKPLIAEVKLAAEAGFKAIIIDDGWQTLDSKRGYAFTGDWQPDRIPNMAEFVDEVHQYGLDVLLWYALPLVGEKSAVYEQFKGKYLRYWDGQGAYELDPRYPEVREYLIDLLSRAVTDWNVDGFKLDFLGRFVANSETDLTADDGRDYASVSDATDRLMTDIMAALRTLRSDVMIEFRQPYIGPLMRKYGNMFRAGDAPNSLAANRVRVVDLRLLSGNTAVHSDMLMWHPEEPLEKAALHVLNILFSVPQISVRFAEIPASHKQMLLHYLDYWRENRSTLMSGDFKAMTPLHNYPLVAGRSESKSITAIFSEIVVDLSDLEERPSADILNAKSSTRVVVALPPGSHRLSFQVFDAVGNQVQSDTFEGDTTAVFSVPASGLLKIQRQSD
ncbi:MAG: alpha-galactosidase [Rhodothermales bacterium]|nr:alpha-galactosidase [Rhodothermales bacterium]